MDTEKAKVRATLGRKGTETRARLLAATRELLKTVSPFNLTVAAIAKAAQSVPGTLYVYFDDVADVFYALSVEAQDAFAEIARLNPDWFAKRGRLVEDVQDFINKFNAMWDDHGHVMHYRDVESDRGNRRFQILRTATSIPFIDRLTIAIREAQPALSKIEAQADAVVLYAAVERIAASRLLFLPDRPGPSDAELVRAQIRIVARHLGVFDSIGAALAEERPAKRGK